MTFDITETLAPTSDQLDGIELAAAPRTFQIEFVSKGSLEQPVNVHFVDFPRPWRPSKGMRRVLAMCWGADASQWAGRRVRLYFDPTVTFGKETPGGTRIEALSHIDGPKKVPMLVTRGKSAVITIKPLADAPAPKDWAAIVATASTREQLMSIRKDAAAAGMTAAQIDPLLTARAAELAEGGEPQ